MDQSKFTKPTQPGAFAWLLCWHSKQDQIWPFHVKCLNISIIMNNIIRRRKHAIDVAWKLANSKSRSATHDLVFEIMLWTIMTWYVADHLTFVNSDVIDQIHTQPVSEKFLPVIFTKFVTLVELGMHEQCNSLQRLERWSDNGDRRVWGGQNPMRPKKKREGKIKYQQDGEIQTRKLRKETSWR